VGKGRWVKIYTKILWDPTVRKLTCTQKWVFITLIILADEEGGVVSGDSATTHHITLAAGSDALTVKKIIRILEENSLITVRKSGDIVIPNWYKYQSTTAAREGRKKRRNAAQEVEVDKIREDIDKTIAAWNNLTNLQQPQKITPEDRKAVGFRLSEGATVEEIESVLTWYNGQLGNASTFWGGNNERGQPIKFNIKRVMKGKLSDKMTFVYEHFLTAMESKTVSKGAGPGSYRPVCCEGEIFDGSGTCPDIEVGPNGVCAKQKTCPNFREHK